MPEILGALARRPAIMAATAMMLAGLLAGCGQKGPLYLPAPGHTGQPVRVKEVPPEVVSDPLDDSINTPATR